MDAFSRDDLIALAKAQPGLALTIFLPTRRAGADTRPFVPDDVTGWKDAVHEGRDRLVQAGLANDDVEAWLAPARALLDRPEFWRYQGDGLAAFIARDTFRAFRLPLHVDHRIALGPRFEVAPLVPLVADERFYVLALSQKSVRLIDGDRDRAEEIPLPPHVPRDLQDALRFDVLEKARQLHTLPAGQAAAEGGRGRPIYHGHGAGDDAKQHILEFCQQIDRGLHDMLHASTRPLVLAAVESLRRSTATPTRIRI